MNIVVVTRLGGIGDLLMLEPTIEALYYKHYPCKIILRTYHGYENVLINHPLIWNTVLDSNKYALGYFGGKSYRLDEHQASEFLRKINSMHMKGSVVYHYDFQGAIEELDGVHGVDAFAAWAKTTVLRRTPSTGTYPISDKLPIVVQLREREDQIRNLTKKDIPNLNNVTYLEDGMQSKDYESTISRANLFIGPDSSGVHLAHALGVKNIIGIYSDRYPPHTRVYPTVKWVRYEERDVLSRYIHIALQPEFKKESVINPTDWIKNKALIYCRGHGLDISNDSTGFASPTLPNSIGYYDLNRAPFDYIYSSYYLQCSKNWEQELKEWDASLRRGGFLFLYLPHPIKKTPNQAWTPSPVALTKWIMENTNLSVFEYSCYPDSIDGFYLVARKK